LIETLLLESEGKEQERERERKKSILKSHHGMMTTRMMKHIDTHTHNRHEQQRWKEKVFSALTMHAGDTVVIAAVSFSRK
jgi:hypothetical protein